MAASPAGRFLLASLIAGALVGRPSAALAVEAVPNQKLLDLMAQGKMETDLGHYDVATKALTAVVDAPDAPPALRAEALVRLGAARRGAGDVEGAVQAFDRASKAPGVTRETGALLVQALGEGLPGPERWAEIWSRLAFAIDRTEPSRPRLVVVWPDVPQATKRIYQGHPISLDLKDGDLQDIFRLFADITGLNVVVFPGIRGHVSIKFDKVPWDRALDLILRPNGLAFRLQDNVLLIVSPQDLGPERSYSGQPIDVDLKEADLRGVLEWIARTGGAQVAPAPAVEGRLTFKLNAVPWDQAFDIVVRVNGLESSRQGKVLAVHGRGAALDRPALVVAAELARKQAEAQSGLAGLSVDRVTLTGIVHEKRSGYAALLEGPGGKTFFGQVGARLQDGEIVALDATSVTFRQRVAASTRKVRMALYPSEGAK